MAVETETDGKPWFYDIRRYLEKNEYPQYISITDKKTLRKLSAKFFLSGDVLYKINLDMVLLRCVDREKADLLIKEIHEGSIEIHANGHAMENNILRTGYYWFIMETN